MNSAEQKKGPNTESPLITFLQEYGTYGALIVSLVAMLGSLFYSEVMHFEPCRLCWFQRICMYPIALLSLIGVIKRDEFVTDYVLPLSSIGLAIGIYHVLMQNGIVSLSDNCSSVSCGLSYVRYLGFISIPLMSSTAFFLITAVMAGTRWANSKIEE